ncbi:methyl-CpG-binding protein 2-like [Dorcoceras hygrometricum]|nr:methyl-CpG-binding protein 2-like [Dorcoceras hygrometricum]
MKHKNNTSRTLVPDLNRIKPKHNSNSPDLEISGLAAQPLREKPQEKHKASLTTRVSHRGNQDFTNNLLRDYRRGNWTLQETMILIEAKKIDDERRMKRLGDGGERGKLPAEPRWKWVEDYCWKKGCLRSQNQCNDKWDNLMRDFKRVREYERRLAEKSVGGNHEEKSYWGMERNERKENNLPPTMLSQTYEALMEVVERKCPRAEAAAAMSSGGAGGSNTHTLLTVVEKSTCHAFGQAASALPPSVLVHPIIQAPPMLLSIPPPAQTSAEPPKFPFSQTLPSVDSDTSEYSDSPAKRRKTRASVGGDDGTILLQEVGSAISKSATIIAEAMGDSEEREERRHKQVVSLHERRLQIEESRVETNKQGINGLVDAINKLANSILALAASHHKTTSK